MGKRKRHSQSEIAAKLAQASDLAAIGKLQNEIANALGVSIMTLYRWRKMTGDSNQQPLVPDQTNLFEQEFGASRRIADLRLENARLRRLVTDLLLEKMVDEEDSVRRKKLVV